MISYGHIFLSKLLWRSRIILKKCINRINPAQNNVQLGGKLQDSQSNMQNIFIFKRIILKEILTYKQSIT